MPAPVSGPTGFAAVGSVAVRTFEVMRETYADLGYDLVELPRASVAERAEFVVRVIRANVGGPA